MDIVIYHKENPSYCLKDSDKVPMSGSNTAFLHLAEELMQKGHRVTMAREPREIPGGHKSDILVVSKNPAVALLHSDKAKKTYLWVHDYIDQPSFLPFYNIRFRQRFQNKVAGILCLSKFQLEAIKKEFNFPRSFLKLTRNGVDPNLFPNTYQRKTVCLYASQPSRGLETLYRIWPEIQKKVPRAKLEVFCSLRGQPSLTRKIKELKNVQLRELQPQAKLMNYFSRAKLLLYPTDFPEISCEVAIEAGAAGLVIVTSAIGALKETAKENILINEPFGSKAYVNEFVSQTVRLLQDEEAWKKISQKNLNLRSYYAWGTIADEWLKIFYADK